MHTFHLYNNIYQFKHQMNLHSEYDPFAIQEYHFFERQTYGFENNVQILKEKSEQLFDYIYSRPNFEIEEILSNFAYQSPIKAMSCLENEDWLLNTSSHEKISIGPQKLFSKKNKKIKKTENSPFHNYQKHLNNALKKLIIIPEFEAYDDQYKKASIDIWQTYCNCQIKTKRILHFIFNERNEYAVNDSQLRTYGLWGIYQKYGDEVISQARSYLSKLAIDQLEKQNIEGYLKSRKLKRKQNFGQYILGFKAELERGYLKRRINIQKIEQPSK